MQKRFIFIISILTMVFMFLTFPVTSLLAEHTNDDVIFTEDIPVGFILTGFTTTETGRI